MTEDAGSFWDTHCVDCGHDLHPMSVCSVIVGGDHSGPDYCPCAIDYPALASAYSRHVKREERTFDELWHLREAARRLSDAIADKVASTALGWEAQMDADAAHLAALKVVRALTADDAVGPREPAEDAP